MEVVNAHDSWTVLAAGNEGTIIAAAEREPYSLRNYTRIGVGPTEVTWSTLLQSSACTQLKHLCLQTKSTPGRQLYDYKPSLLQPQFLQSTYLSNHSVIFCYSHCACSDSQYIIQHMYCVIHHLWHIISYREEWNIYCNVDYIPLCDESLRKGPLCRNM